MEKSLQQSSVLTHAQLLFGAIAIICFALSTATIFILPDLRNRSDLLSMSVTTLTNGFMMVLGFFYGSSQSSARKTELLSTTATQPQTVNIGKSVSADTVVDSSGGNVDEVITNGKF